MSMSCAIAKFDTMLWGLMRRAFTLFVAVFVFVFVFVRLSRARCGCHHRAIARVTVISSPQTESLQASKEDPKARDSRLKKEN